MTAVDDGFPAPSFVPARAEHVSTAAFDGETVLYDAIACRPVLLNVSAAAVWAALDGDRTVAEIVVVVAAAFGAEPEAVRSDVGATISEFAALGLLAGSSR